MRSGASCSSKSGNIWFGTTNGLYCFDGNKFTRPLDDAHLINSENLRLKKIQCMLEDRYGIIWLGSGLGETEGLLRFDDDPLLRLNRKSMDGFDNLLQDRAGKIWLSTRSQGIWLGSGDGFGN